LLTAGFEVSNTAGGPQSLILEEPERLLPYGLAEQFFPGGSPSDIVDIQPSELNALERALRLHLGGLV
jgi:hypothetical protein